ncbi:uncharacterized protein LOC101848212 [Aplysia californica]|uniref:Uncharacterized protein LOC101848212 n=1 Tax=Aplysia californica TaxID=6500 RepID=A0ABM1A3E5_APLCA|nr:uncharacterized protein LOC101848212 [Aplysia californica]
MQVWRLIRIMSPPPPEDHNVIKSVHHDWPAYVTFINRTSDPVDIIWRDYRGGCVRYKQRLEAGKHHYQNTFVTHPWQAWYSDTFEKVTIGGKFIFMPHPWRGEQTRTVVYIDRPVHTLLKLCLNKVRSLVHREDIEALEIPKDLFDRLKRRKTMPVRDAGNHNHQRS